MKKKKSPPSRFLVDRNQSREEKERIGGGDKVWVGTTTDSVLLFTPTHLLPHWPSHPAVLSLWGLANPCQQRSAVAPLILWNTQRRAHQTQRATQGP